MSQLMGILIVWGFISIRTELILFAYEQGNLYIGPTCHYLVLVFSIFEIKVYKFIFSNTYSAKLKGVFTTQYLFQQYLRTVNRRQSQYSIMIFRFFSISEFFHILVYAKINNFLIRMMKRFTQLLLNNQRRNMRLMFSTGKDNKINQNNKQQVKKQAKQQAKQQKRYEQKEYDDDQQPVYQRQDRTTPGWIIYRIFFWTSTAILSYNVYLVSQHNKKTPVEDQTGAVPGFITAAKFIYKNYNQATQFLTKPPLQKLLPDVVHPQLQQKTLVLNLTGTLVNTEYIFGKGLVVHKRPGLQQFLKKMSQLYEVVIFSDQQSMLLSTIIQSLDPRRQIFTNYFGNQCMVFSKGRYIKDLKYLNRDLRKVVVVDKSKKIVQKQTQNVIVLSQYQGNESDKQLISLTGLLQSLAKSQKDVRKTIEQMGDDPVKKYEQVLKEKQQKVKNTKGSRFFGFFQKKN